MHIYGYHEGLGQPVLMQDLTASDPVSFNVAHVDAWFKEYLAIPIPQTDGVYDPIHADQQAWPVDL